MKAKSQIQKDVINLTRKRLKAIKNGNNQNLQRDFWVNPKYEPELMSTKLFYMSLCDVAYKHQHKFIKFN